MTTKQSNIDEMVPQESKSIAKKQGTVLDYLQSTKMKEQLAMALPKQLDPDRFVRSAVNEFRLNTALQQCSVPSVLGYFMQSAALGLEPATVLGHCYAVPFNNKKTGNKEVQFILGYRGMLAIARRSGEVATVSSHIVYENDEFEICYGDEERLKHKPLLKGDRGKMIGVYVIVKFKDGSYQHMYMSREKIEERRKKSRASDSGPWVTDYNEMAKKTVFRALFKWLPVNIEAQQMVARDESSATLNIDSMADNDLMDIDFTVSEPID